MLVREVPQHRGRRVPVPTPRSGCTRHRVEAVTRGAIAPSRAHARGADPGGPRVGCGPKCWQASGGTNRPRLKRRHVDLRHHQTIEWTDRISPGGHGPDDAVACGGLIDRGRGVGPVRESGDRSSELGGHHYRRPGEGDQCVRPVAGLLVLVLYDTTLDHGNSFTAQRGTSDYVRNVGHPEPRLEPSARRVAEPATNRPRSGRETRPVPSGVDFGVVVRPRQLDQTSA